LWTLARSAGLAPPIAIAIARRARTSRRDKGIAFDGLDLSFDFSRSVSIVFPMGDSRERLPGTPVRPSDMPTGELIELVVAKVSKLARKEVELAKAEIKSDLKAEAALAKGIGIAGLCALVTVNLLAVALALFLARWMPAWGAAVVVAAFVMAIGTIAGWIGWKRRVQHPLSETRRTLEEDVKWAKEQIT